MPITAKLVADLITAAGANRVLAMDLHAGQIQGFFDIPVDHLFAAPVRDRRLPRQEGPARTRCSSRPTRAASSARAPSPSGSRRASPSSTSGATAPTWPSFMHLIGDVKGKDVVIIDDMIDTAGTLIQAVDALRREGARRILACGGARRAVRPGHRSASTTRCSKRSSSPTRSRSPPDKQLPEDPRSLGRPAAGRGDPPHPRRGIRSRALRLANLTERSRRHGNARADHPEARRAPARTRPSACAAPAASPPSSTAGARR